MADDNAPRDLLAASLRDRSTWGILAWQWIDGARDYAVQVTSEDPAYPADLAMFWIRLVGVLTDLRSWLSEAREKAPEDVRLTAALLLGTIQHLRSTLSEDEALYAEYRRHVECHPFQNAYDPLIKNGAPRPSRRSSVLDVEFSPMELDRRIKAVIVAHGREVAIGPHVARRVLPVLERLRLQAVAINRRDALWI